MRFLAGLGAVVFRKEAYCPEEFADLLEVGMIIIIGLMIVIVITIVIMY